MLTVQQLCWPKARGSLGLGCMSKSQTDPPYVYAKVAAPMALEIKTVTILKRWQHGISCHPIWDVSVSLRLGCTTTSQTDPPYAKVVAPMALEIKTVTMPKGRVVWQKFVTQYGTSVYMGRVARQRPRPTLPTPRLLHLWHLKLKLSLSQKVALCTAEVCHSMWDVIVSKA